MVIVVMLLVLCLVYVLSKKNKGQQADELMTVIMPAINHE